MSVGLLAPLRAGSGLGCLLLSHSRVCWGDSGPRCGAGRRGDRGPLVGDGFACALPFSRRSFLLCCFVGCSFLPLLPVVAFGLLAGRLPPRGARGDVPALLAFRFGAPPGYTVLH